MSLKLKKYIKINFQKTSIQNDTVTYYLVQLCSPADIPEANR